MRTRFGMLKDSFIDMGFNGTFSRIWRFSNIHDHLAYSVGYDKRTNCHNLTAILIRQLTKYMLPYCPIL